MEEQSDGHMVISADFLYNGDYTFFENVELAVSDGKIRELRERHQGSSGTIPTLEMGGALIMPGLVNAHTHLELGFLHGRLEPTDDFPSWLQEVKSRRESADAETLATAAADGIAAATASGTTLIVDHTSSDAAVPALAAAPVRTVAALETAGFEADRHVEYENRLAERLRSTEPGEMHRVGIAPHSVYRVSEPLLTFCVEVARREELLFSVHAAEHPGELELMKEGTGEFRTLLERMGTDLGGWEAPGVSAVEYLHRLGALDGRTLCVHCNYLDEPDVAFLRLSGAAVVYCPRSHAYFGHREHPMQLLLRRGVHVVLGTDSLASSPSVSVLDELRFLKRRYDYPSDMLVSLATAQAGAAVWGGSLGKLEVGAPADFCVIEIPERVDSPQEALDVALLEDTRVLMTVCAGRPVHMAAS